MEETFGCLSQGSRLRKNRPFPENQVRGSIVVSIFVVTRKTRVQFPAAESPESVSEPE